MDNLTKQIEKHFGIDDMHKRTRQREYADARAVYSYILKERGRSYPSIGKELHKNHATIMHSVKKVKNIKELLEYAKMVQRKNERPALARVRVFKTNRIT